ncbi:MAG: ABC-F family ATP-binding cassette domain-containing protein [Spirosomataceae bacterium]
MNYLSAEAIGRNLGERWLFQNLTFGILQGEKVALIGSNGTGKSSMLDILAGKTPPDGGVVSLRKDIRVGYLEQNPVFQESKTILETIFYAENSITRAIKNYDKAIETNNQDLLAECIEILDSQNGWDYEAKVKQILGKLGILDTDKLISELSGGQKKRVALARVLIENPDFLILDEPTNHLDLESIEWLEGHLSSSNTTLLLVTHDRYFLDKVCNRILELANNQIYKYTGSYAYFLEKKAERQEMEAATQEKLKNQLSKELEWMRRQPKARTTKAQYRIDAFHDLKEKATGFKKEDKLELNMRSERMGKKIIEIQHVSKAFNGQDFIKEFSYTFKRGDRIGIVGKNGMGKSTLLQMITDQLKPDSGKVVKGETIKIGYYRQDGLDFKEDQKVIEAVREIAEFVKLGDGRELTVSAFLTLFLFPPKMQYNYIHKLSGGEKRRLQLLKVLVQSPNFLILDEPTNDLDIDTLNVLEDFLTSFDGCLLVVSHDRYFMDRLIDHIFAFEGNGKIKDFPGNYTEYRLWSEEQALLNAPSPTKTAAPVPTPVVAPPPAAPKKKLSFKEQREFEQLEKDIATIQVQLTALHEQISQETDYTEITALGKKVQALEDELEEKEFRWLELAEIAG